MSNLLSQSRKPYRLIPALSAIALMLSLGACGNTSTDTTTQDDGQQTASTHPPLEVPLQGNMALTGAGASFPAPLYQNWFIQLSQKVPQLQVNYQSTGSGAGVQQFIQGLIDFGASDVAMTDEEIAQVNKGVLLLPMTAGSIVLAYNLPGVEELKISRAAVTGIFSGNITKWNDPEIAKANPDVQLPDKPIIAVHRSDGSGTTGVFTKVMSAISPEWEKEMGQGKSIEWPTNKGKFIGGKGNEGVTASVQQNEGAIGYVEYGFAKNNNIPVAALENQSGNFIVPNEESAAATLDAVELPDNLRAFITDPEGDNSYPIVTYSWMLLYKKYDDPQKAIAMEAMVQFGLNQGQDQSAALGYVPLPQSVREKVAAAADEITPDFQIKVN